MLSFDYITDKAFRTALERDYREMNQSLDCESWKSVQVLAGSIVETLLIDYLTATPNASRNKDPLRMDLSAAIEVCKTEGVLSNRTADLCSVVRSYRNLIHPGRVVRLNEPAPNKNSASVAAALVQIISEEVSEARRKTAGLTAEQILAKIRTDENARLILKHLLSEANEHQKERLLLELIPTSHRQVHDIDHETAWEEARRLASSYRVVFEAVSVDVRRKAVGDFVRILKQEDGQSVSWFSRTFFVSSDIQYVEATSEPLVREYLFGRIGTMHSLETLPLVEGITPYLPVSDVERWLTPFVMCHTSARVDEERRSAVFFAFSSACFDMPAAFSDAVKAQLLKLCDGAQDERRKVSIQELIDEINLWC